MKIRNLLFILLAFSIGNRLIAQNGDPIEEGEQRTVIPPSPTAYELGKYGQVPVGLFTGIPNINIPLYQYKAGLLSLDISLSYNSNGIKVDQLETNVGLGWSLNAGGVITRIVRDTPDEDSYQYFPEEDIADDIHSPVSIAYFDNATSSDLDTESDIYMYNFCGYSGSFTFNNDKELLLMPHNNMKLISQVNENNEIYFDIIMADGITYSFGAIERTKFIGQGDQLLPKPPVITAWYLSKITHPSGDQININYQYYGLNYKSSITQYHSKNYVLFTGCPGGPDCGAPNYISTYENKSIILGGKRVGEITSNNPNYGTIIFTYAQNHPDPEIEADLISSININNGDELLESFQFQYYSTLNKRIYLRSITFKDIEKKYIFDYIEPDELCARLSFAQDYWGYYNGENNAYFVPGVNTGVFECSTLCGDREPNNSFAQKGLLKRITYPTKGYSGFEYESNTYWGYQTVYPPPVEIHLDAVTDGDTFGTLVSEVTSVIETSQDVYIFSSVQFNLNGGEWCDPVTYPWDIEAIISVKNLFTNQNINIFNYGENIGWYSVGEFPVIIANQDGSFKVHFEEGASYEVRLEVLRPCLDAALTLEYYDEAIEDVYSNLETGGSRIKSIIAFEPETDVQNKTVYYYNKYNNPEQSSGDPGTKGYYISKVSERITCNIMCMYEICEYFKLCSESLLPLINSGNNNIYYTCVTISHGGENFENGGETHEFIVNRDVPGNQIVGLDGNHIGTAYSNIGWDHGLEKSVEIFKVNNDQKIVLSRQNNFFKNDERNSNISHSYAIQKIYEFPCGELLHSCTEDEIIKTYLRRTCTAANPEHKHIWTLGAIPGLLDDFICIAPPYPAKYHNSWEVCYHPCFGKEPGDIIVYPNALDNLSIIEYFNCSFWYYLDSTVFINYDQFGNNPLTTYKKFFYDNERHIQLTRTIEKDGKGNIIQAQFRYPQDYNEIENFAHLIDANIISSPIVEEEYYNSKIVSGKINKYNDEGQLIEISQYENENLIDKPKHDPDVITTIPEFYQKKIDIQYDPGNHKMIQQQPTNNIITSYIWGYNFTQVVAKIENADYYTVLQVMQIPIEGIQNMNDNELQTVFNNLRENMPNAMITSYTYKSGVGMTSETDPAGKTTYYEYDNFARLKFIKDKDGNIIKRYRYHFKNQ